MLSSDYFEDVFSVWSQEEDDTIMSLDDAEEEQDDFIFEEYRPLSPALRMEDSDEDGSQVPESHVEEPQALVKIEEEQTSKPTFNDDSSDNERGDSEAHERDIDSESEEEGEQEESNVDNSADEAAAGLEGLVLSFLTQLSTAVSHSSVRRVKDLSSKNRIEISIANRNRAPAADGTIPSRTMRFPLKGKGASIKPFAQLFRVANLAHEALIDGIPMTKRDMYYKDVQLFKSQSVVDRLVDDLAATLDVGRSGLNVRAASKGLLVGASLCIHLNDGSTVHATDAEPVLIPVAEDIERFSLDQAVHWVLIVEKEAVFQTLCRTRFACSSALPGSGIIITGKGYPDLATRQLVRTLSDNLPEDVPILALVDGDAFGLDIASVYKFGSHALRHENNKLAADRVECIGVWASELPSLGIDRDAMLTITKADEKKARAMLLRPSDTMPTQWKRELMHMLHTRRKAETEILSNIASNVFDHLDPSVSSGSFAPCLSQSNVALAAHPLVRYLATKIKARVLSDSDDILVLD